MFRPPTPVRRRELAGWYVPGEHDWHVELQGLHGNTVFTSKNKYIYIYIYIYTECKKNVF